MSNLIARESLDLFDPVTGAHVGRLDANGKEQIGSVTSDANGTPTLITTNSAGQTVATVVGAQAASDSLPTQAKTVSVTGQVVAGPCKVASIRCISGTTPTIVLRDNVTQNQADTDTTSPQLFSASMSAGDVLRVPIEAAFGLHATLGGTSPVFELEF